MLTSLITLSYQGLLTTLSVFFSTLLCSIPLGLLIAPLRDSKIPWVKTIVKQYIYVMRSTPLLLQTMFLFFGLPLVPVVSITLPRFTAIWLAFTLNYAAYFAEIFRGGIQSIPKGQYQAAKVLGLSKKNTFRYIIVPQIIKITLPSVANEVINLLKDTSLVYILGMSDILKVAKAVSNTYASFVPYLFVACLYFILVFLLTFALERIEEKFAYYE